MPVKEPSKYGAAGDPPLTIAARLSLDEPFSFDAHLAKRLTLRQINPKEAFTIRDERGEYFRASLKSLGSSGGAALPYEIMPRSPESRISITLACAVLARQRMLFVMQKATELGVSRIVPLLTEYSVPKEGLEHEKAAAWPGQILRAARQCRRASLPDLDSPTALTSFLASPEFRSADIRVALDDRSDPIAASSETFQQVVLLVGPEGGFSDAERAQFADKTRPWVLGGRVLRAETAVIVGLSAVHMQWGDFAAA